MGYMEEIYKLWFNLGKGKLDLMVYAGNPSTWKVQAGRSRQVEGRPGLHSEFKTSLHYKARPCLTPFPTKKKVKGDNPVNCLGFKLRKWAHFFS